MQVRLGDGARQICQYSLSAAPGSAHWRITVKRVDGGGEAGPDGEVSTWLYENAQPGELLEVSRPSGDLVLADDDGPLLLASAGIGSTPMLSILGHLAETAPGRRVSVVHADRSPADHAHRDEQRELAEGLDDAELHLWYQDAPAGLPANARLGYVDLESLDLSEDLTAYLCGPLPFMRAVRGQLLSRGVPAGVIHYEVFGPDLWLAV